MEKDALRISLVRSKNNEIGENYENAAPVNIYACSMQIYKRCVIDPH